jgi:pimeloyl-ACP methyl ester carboxylesterase
MSTASSLREAYLEVPGARLYYRCVGTGPLLVIGQGGAGDADSANGLAAALARDFTVVSYDRRGLSRSTDDALLQARPSLEIHVDDLARLVDALAPEAPVDYLGVSIGAVIGVALAARAPTRFRHLIAHEPPIAQVLPPERQAELTGVQQELEATARKEGPRAAMRAFSRALGVNPLDREEGVEIGAPGDLTHLGKNLAVFLTHDAPAVRTHVFDLAALAAAADRLILAVGASSAAALHAEPAFALARTFGRTVVTFPGGHAAFASHPRGWAAKLRALLLVETSG